jgi:hypothetical protein
VTPIAVHNRPGLTRIATRIGTHGGFLSTMLARLSAVDYPELAPLRTRDPNDASIALLDAWATVADVLTFYQERIANEGYLRTATERRSLVELGRLINYAPRPGVAASVYLAFEMEKEPLKAVIPKGTKVNSIPGPGETMEAFETSDEISARPEWNAIKPRLVQPQNEAFGDNGLYLRGTATRLKVGDLLLVRPSPESKLQAARLAHVGVDHDNDRTRIDFGTKRKEKFDPPLDRFASLLRQPTVAPANATRLERSIETSFAASADTLPRLATSFQPALAATLFPALRNAAPKAEQQIEVYAMRIEARAFGHNAPLQLTSVGAEGNLPTFAEWHTDHPWGDTNDDDQAKLSAHRQNRLLLDNDYDVGPDSFVVIEDNNTGGNPVVLENKDLKIGHVSLHAYGLSGKSLEIISEERLTGWLTVDDQPFSIVRSARVYLGSEKLELAGAPVVGDVAGDTLELDGLYEGLDPGRWLIVEGERTDIKDERGLPIPGIRAAELVMLGAVTQAVAQVAEPNNNVPLPLGANGRENGEEPPPRFVPGDTYHSTLTLAAMTGAGSSGLAYSYKRDSVTIYANVAHATHGETRTETLGSGNAAEALQQFRLKLPPLTHLAAANPSGIASTLEVRINDVRWHEAATLAEVGANDRKYTTRSCDDDKVDVVFGNGRHGLRLPTGRENVKAKYRNGIGKPGNVKAKQISLLGSRPLGVKGVVNPMRASGGANRDEAEAIRRNAPLAIFALDRLISTTDYADFARSFGGIGKATATRDKGVVEVVIAGVDDIAIDESADLFRTLKDALHRFGDPLVRIRVKVRERAALVIKCGLRIETDYVWETVEPEIRAAMLDAFSFDNQSLGAPLFLSAALRTIHKVKGVAAADIDVFDILTEAQLLADDAVDLTKMLNEAKPRISLAPNQIAYLLSDIPETLILQEVSA